MLTNDKPTHKAAQESAIQIVGSIGVLDYAVEQGKLRGLAAVGLLQEMISHGARISTDTLQEVQRRWSTSVEIKKAVPRVSERVLVRTDDMS